MNKSVLYVRLPRALKKKVQKQAKRESTKTEKISEAEIGRKALEAYLK